jgi:hypothetical protein
MLVSSHAAHNWQIRSNFYKQSGNTGTDFDCTETTGEVVIEMTGKYDFTVTFKVISVVHANVGQNITPHNPSLGLFLYHFLHMMVS